MRVCYCLGMCSHINAQVFSLRWPQMVARPLTCVSRKWTKLVICTGTVAKICLGSTGAVRRGKDQMFLSVQWLYTSPQPQQTHDPFFFFIVSVRDAQCGKIQCLTSGSKPIENNAVPIETTVTFGNKKIYCMGTHVYKVGQGAEEPQGDTLDPGLVMTGTKCGVDSVRHVWGDVLNWIYVCIVAKNMLWITFSRCQCVFHLAEHKVRFYHSIL